MTVPLFGQGSDTPVQVLVGRGRASFDLSAYVDLDGGGLEIEDTGNQADDTATFELVDADRVINDIGPEAAVLIKAGSEERFKGFIRSFEPAPFTVSNRIVVQCVGLSSLIDKCIIPPGSAYTRKRGESDRARILWLLKTFGGPFLKYASNDFSKIQVLNQNMPRQRFGSLTLRQGIEQVLGEASDSANYYFDQPSRLHTFDDDNAETDAAPYEINTTPSPASNEAVPEGLRVSWDSSELVNYWYVRGKNAAGSGAFSDETSISIYGRRQGFIDGPDSDTVKKARRLGRAALHDTKNPMRRLAYTVSGAFVSRNGSTWAPGQQAYHTVTGFGWLRHRERIIRVKTRYIDSTGGRAMDIEAGALRRFGIGWENPQGVAGYNPARPVIEFGDGPGVAEVIPPERDDANEWFVLDDMNRVGTGISYTPGTPDAPYDGGWSVSVSTFDSPASYGLTGSTMQIITTARAAVKWQAVGPVVTLNGDVTDNLGSQVGPWNQEEQELLFRFRTSRLTVGSYLKLTWQQDHASAGYYQLQAGVDLGGSPAVGQSQGVWFRPDASGLVYADFGHAEVGKTIAVNTDYLMRVACINGKGKIKVWAESASEPAWDLTTPLVSLPIDGVSDTAQFMVELQVGDGSGVVTASLDYIKYRSVPERGQRITDEDVATGDGVTTTFATGRSFARGTAAFRVDGLAVAPTSSDGVTGSFTFDAAPSSGAVVTADYIVA